jgi:hypothetical protein
VPWCGELIRPSITPARRCLAAKHNEKDTADDKKSVLDFKARDRRGRQYNVQMQMVAPNTYPKRGLYYWAELRGQQMREGTMTPRASLCEACSHVREVVSGKGSRFLLCRLSHSDARYPRYPAQPVLHCGGFTTRVAPRDDTQTEAERR